MSVHATTPSSDARADTAAPPTSSTARALVWDLPVRLVHWLMVGCFAGAWLSAESERLQLLHITLGYTLAGLVVFRLVWGLVGTRPARFASFVRGPAAALDYVRALLAGRAPHSTGHNPAGALAIVGLLSLAALTTALGWATYHELGGDWLGEAHELAASAMLALVGLHVAGVVVGSVAHRENLPRAMVTGRKHGLASESAEGSRWPVAALILAAVLGFWAWQWQSAPSQPWQTGANGEALGPLATLQALVADDDRDDDDDEH